MRCLRMLLAGVAVAMLGNWMPTLADDAVVNTQEVISTLVGGWELQPKNKSDYKQRLTFNGGTCVCGQWQQSSKTLPTSITFYVEGDELLLQYYHEPKEVGNYRLKQLRFSYKLDDDVLTLTRDDVSENWSRIKKSEPKKD